MRDKKHTLPWKMLQRQHQIGPISIITIMCFVSITPVFAYFNNTSSISSSHRTSILTPPKIVKKIASVPSKFTPPPLHITPKVATPAAVTPIPVRVHTSTPQPVATTAPSPGTGIHSLQPAPQTTSSSPSPTSSTSTTSTSSAPSAASGGYSSTNWSGYVATSGRFSAVSGSWVIPSVSGNGTSTSGDAAWVGIGGVSSSDLIQAGTDNTVAADGTVTTYAFYELLPSSAMMINSLVVHTGDSISTSIVEVSSGSWSISILDNTTGGSFNTTLSYTSSNSSAEWIEEDPSYASGSLMPFDNFDHIVFSNLTATMNGVSTSPASNGAQPITLVSSTTQPVATPSVLINSGTGFWVTHN